MYNYFNIGNTDKNDTQIHNDVKSFGLNTVLNQAPNNINNILSKDVRRDENFKNINYPAAKNVSLSNNDIKALQHSLNVLDFTDPFGKKLKEDGIWGPKTKWAWDTMQGRKEISFEKMANDKYDPGLQNSNFEHNYSDVYKPDEYMKTVYDPKDDSDDSYYKTLSLLPKKSKNLLSDVWNETKWAFNTLGNFANETQKAAQRKLWKTVSKNIINDYYKCPTTAWLLEHSLQDNPSDVYRDNYSRIANLVNTSKPYLDALDTALSQSKNGKVNGYLKDIAFGPETGDLYYSIHNASIYVDGYKQNNGAWIIHATMTDTYDFTQILTFMNDSGFSWTASKGTIANDAAVLSQKTGAINPYKITVDFYTTRYV